MRIGQHFSPFGQGESRILVCPLCMTESCADCRDSSHPGMTCLQYSEKQFEQIDIQVCPRCKTKVEKVEGCNHMTCLFCRYEFCWICGGPYTRGHFIPFNPMGCGADYYSDRRHVCIRVLLKLLYILAFLILFPLMLVFLIPCYFGYIGFEFTYKHLRKWLHRRDDSFRRQERSRCSKIGIKLVFGLIALLAGTLSFAVGVLVNMVVAPVFLVVFVFCMMPYFFFVECM